MNGFTLVETIIYSAISSLITVSFIFLGFTLSDTETYLTTRIHNEITGLTALKDIAEKIAEHKEVDNSLINDYGLENFEILSTTQGLITVHFTITSQQFTCSLYEPH